MTISEWFKRRWLRLVLLLLIAAVMPSVFSRVASTWRGVRVYSLDGADRDVHRPRRDGLGLKLASYNIAHGRGLAVSNRDGGSPDQRLRRLDGIAELLREVDADVVVLNEVDFEASWSHSVNQARYLAEKAGYPFVAEQRNLDLRVLMWTWRFGNAMLSRYPIENAEVLDLPGTVGWETVLAGKKRGLICDIRMNGDLFRVMAAHFCHRSESVRVQSARVLLEKIGRSPHPVIAAGDLNSTPPGFPNSGVDANGENAVDVLDRSGIFRRFPENPPDHADGFTFSSDNPGSVIDWILIPREWGFAAYTVHTSKLSDHRLIHTEIRRGEK